MPQVALTIVAEFKAKQGVQDRMRQALERMIEPTQNDPPIEATHCTRVSKARRSSY